MGKQNIGWNKLQKFWEIKAGTVNLQKVIDYCKLHETLSNEDYRKLAVDEFNDYERIMNTYNIAVTEMVKEFYPVLVEKLKLEDIETKEEKNFKKKIDGLARKLEKKIDFSAIKEWKNYCLGCKEPDENCRIEREKLEKVRGDNSKDTESIIKDAIKTIKEIVKYTSDF